MAFPQSGSSSTVSESNWNSEGEPGEKPTLLPVKYYYYEPEEKSPYMLNR